MIKTQVIELQEPFYALLACSDTCKQITSSLRKLTKSNDKTFRIFTAIKGPTKT